MPELGSSGKGSVQTAPGRWFRCPSCGKQIELPKNLNGPALQCDNPKCDLQHVFSFFRGLSDVESERNRIREDQENWSKPYVFRVGSEPDGIWVLAHFQGKVQRFQPKRLTDVVSLHALRGMLTGFGDEKGCTFTIIEADGQRIEPFQIHNDIADMLGIPLDRRTPFRNFTALCLALRNAAQNPHPVHWRHPCEEFDAQVVQDILGSPPTASHSPRHCPAGLLDFAVPITVSGDVLAVLFSGQRRLNTPAAEAQLAERLPKHASACGLPPERAQVLLEATPLLEPEMVPTFQQRLTEVTQLIQDVAEKNTLEIRKTRDQYLLEEIAARIRHRMHAYVASATKPLLALAKSRMLEYIGLNHCSLLYTRAPGSVTFFRQLDDGSTTVSSEELPPACFTPGPGDRDGLICLFDSPQRSALKNSISRLTTELPPPLFLLRILLESGTQLLLVFHGHSITEMAPAYAPHSDNLYIRRSFFTRLSRVVQGELDIIQRYGSQQKALMSIMHTAHQPLDGILQIESMIRADLSPGPLAEKWLRDVKHTAEHAQALCGCMSRVFKCLIDQGSSIDQSAERVDVEAIVKSVAKSLRLYESADRSTREPHKRGLSIEYVQKVRRFTVLADRETVLFVIFNLLHNAEKYSDLNSYITVEYSTEGTLHNRLFIKVKSVGMPISAEARALDKPFELFWRGTNRKTGLGVGLWASRYLLERQGPPGLRGEIHLLPIESGPAGPRLTIFCVRFPLVRQPPAEHT